VTKLEVDWESYKSWYALNLHIIIIYSFMSQSKTGENPQQSTMQVRKNRGIHREHRHARRNTL